MQAVDTQPLATPAARRRGRTSPLLLAAGVVAAVLLMPILTVCLHVFLPDKGTWRHLVDTVLASYVVNTLLLAVGTGIGVVAIGVPAAWMVSMCRFPGRRLLEWALVLPLAVPAYVLAYAYTDFLQTAGPVQTAIRDLTGWAVKDYWFPEVRSLPGAIGMFVMVLYPYVYLLARAAFLEQSVSVLETSRMLGCTPWSAFFRVAVPLARPAIVAGMALALMETLADFGTVAYFGVPTFTTGIYRTWFSFGDPTAAAQLSTALLGFAAVLIAAERWSRGQARYHQTRGRFKALPGYRLTGLRAGLAIFACVVPLFFGFLLPGVVLLRMAFVDGDAEFGPRYFMLVGNSFILSGVTAMIAVAISVLLAYAMRLQPGAFSAAIGRLAGMGYAVPGSVIAIGVLIPFGLFDNALDAWMRKTFGISTGLLLTGGITGLVFAYLVRYLAVALQTVDASLAKITPNMDAAARTLGSGPGRTLLRVHAPIMGPSLITAGLIVFVDVMKELPATLLLRPFNFDTLAVQAFNLAADERLTEASTASLGIVAVALLPIVAMSRAIAKSRAKDLAQ